VKYDLQAKENKKFGPVSLRLNFSIHTQSRKGGAEDQACRPAVIEGEWKMQEEFIADVAYSGRFHKPVNFLNRQSSYVVSTK
jgi:hypothetical protein